MVATGSMDHFAKIFDVEKKLEVCNLKGHVAEIVNENFSSDGKLLLTISFDHTAKVIAYIDMGCSHWRMH